ncbi:MAG: hypothetical protein LIO90_04135 [Bacteroidales bacterium]|nr:hypothetical protein [Bacteroidales bacterium]
MKRILLSMAVIGSLMFVGCSSAEKAERNERDIAKKIEATTNPDSLKVYVNDAKTYVEGLISQGKTAEAQAYIDSIAPVIKDKAPELLTTFDTVKTSLGIEEAKEKADSLKDAVTDSIKAKADAAKDAASTAVDNAKDAASQAVTDAKNAAAEKVSDAADKASTAVSNAANDAAAKATDAAKGALDKLNNDKK